MRSLFHLALSLAVLGTLSVGKVSKSLAEEEETTEKTETQPSPKAKKNPTAKPSAKPSVKSSPKPTVKPSVKPTVKPSSKPSSKPTVKASAKPSTKASPLSPWTENARKLIGEPAGVTARSISELKRDPDLEEKLKKALGSKDHFLALDVIASLKMKNFVPTVLDFAARDKTGFSYHALNQLIEKKDFDRIGKVYRERLKRPKTSMAAKMAMLDTMGRIGTEIEPDLLNKLLVEDEPEVRSAALYYLRNAILHRRRQELYPFLKSALKDPLFQIRLQTLYLTSEVPLVERKERDDFFVSFYPNCAQDPVPQVKDLCNELARKGKEAKR